MSQNQKGGVTSNQSTKMNENPKGKSFFTNRYILIIGFIASILGILAYFGFQPTKPQRAELQNKNKIYQLKDSSAVADKHIKKDTMLKQNRTMKKDDEKTKKNNAISIGDVSGDVVISQNQKGGITAHSVNINEPQIPVWTLSKSEKISDTEWRTTLSARGVGNLAYYNWNILLTLNTEVLRREDVPAKVSVGPWMPLSVQGGTLSKNQFFIGFSEFKPGQCFSIYLYSKVPIEILKKDVLSN